MANARRGAKLAAVPPRMTRPLLSRVSAIVLAGGLGTRLRPVIGALPKALAQVAGRPWIDQLLDQLEAASVPKVVLATGYGSEALRTALGSGRRHLDLVHAPEPEPLGTAGALRFCSPLVASDLVIVLNGDSYCGVDLRDLVAFHRQSGCKVTLTLVRVAETGRFGLVELDEAARVERFVEKGPSSNGSTGLVNAGVYVMERSFLAELPARTPLSLEREVFPALIEQGIAGFVCDGPFLDIGVPEDFGRAEAFVRGLRSRPEGDHEVAA